MDSQEIGETDIFMEFGEEENENMPSSAAVLNPDAEKTDEQILEQMAKLDKKLRPRQPRPKLDEARLTSARGLPMLPELFRDYKPRHKDEFANLAEVLAKMENWAHCLFPKLGFRDFVERAEVLGRKRTVQACLHRMRRGEPVGEDEDTQLVDPRTPSPPPDRQPIPHSPKRQSPGADDFPDDDDMDDIFGGPSQASAPSRARVSSSDGFPDDAELGELLAKGHSPPLRREEPDWADDDDDALFTT